ncbi:hypothetical protein GQ42DRAFT_163069 [Ramicandelaber brevisporus]|nr:hypothetical protein GQ42DRAFT_163069 [Ramicandelaber brevisporus]
MSSYAPALVEYESDDERTHEILDMTSLEHNVWLVKVPKFLAEKWSKKDIKEDEYLGDLQVFETMSATGEAEKKLAIALPNTDRYKDVPKRYMMTSQSKGRQVQNTYVFSEQRLLRKRKAEPVEAAKPAVEPPPPPPTKGGARGRGKGGAQSWASKGARDARDAKDAKDSATASAAQKLAVTQNAMKKQRTGYMRDIPSSRVAMFGTVVEDFNLAPTLDGGSEYLSIINKRTVDSMKHERKTQVWDPDTENARKRAFAPGTVKVGLAAKHQQPQDTFITAKKKITSNEQKMSRMAKDTLVDLLFTLFTQYRYWPLRALIKKTQQPQAWLKEILGELCVLNRKGPYNSMYELKPEFRRGEEANEGAAPGDAEDADEEDFQEVTAGGSENAGGDADEDITGAAGDDDEDFDEDFDINEL